MFTTLHNVDGGQEDMIGGKAHHRAPQIDLSKAWRISHELEGHTDDVKSLSLVVLNEKESYGQTEIFVDASRDETSNTWTRSTPTSRPGNPSPSQWVKGTTFKGNRYQNSVTTYDDQQHDSLGILMMGGLDGRILVFRMNDPHPSDKAIARETEEPFQVLQDHYDNVCHLSVSSAASVGQASNPLLISASWDCTSRIWRLHSDAKYGSIWKPLHVLKGHKAAVWAAEIVDCKPEAERYLTASADYFIRLWNGEHMSRIFAGHNDVARGIALLPAASSQTKEETAKDMQPPFYDGEELFATISNDGTVRIWSLDHRRWPSGNTGSGGEALRTMTCNDGTSDILYDVCLAGWAKGSDHRLLVTSGEGGRVNLWDVDVAQCVASIDQPVTSTWSVIVLPCSGDIVTADSDGKIRVYTQRPFNTSFMAQEHRLEVRARGGHSELDSKQIKEHEERCAVIAEKRVRYVRMRSEVITVQKLIRPFSRQHQHGVRADLIARDTQVREGNNNVFEGHAYDSLLMIDISDDREPLTLPINKGGG